MIAIHFHVGAMLDEIFRFIAGCHLAAVDTAITGKSGAARRPDVDVGSIVGRSLRAECVFRCGVYLAEFLAVSFVSLPAQDYKNYR